MRLAMRHRRFTSWLLLVVLMLGTALPMHAGAHARAQDAVGRDLCTTTGSKEAPAIPDRAHADACATCFACGGAAALPGAGPVAVFLAAPWVPIAGLVATRHAAVHGRALARGPPLPA